MRLVFSPHGWKDYTHLQATDRARVKRINRLIDDVVHDPFSGTDKPEQPAMPSSVPGHDGPASNTGSSTGSTASILQARSHYR